MIKCLYCGGQHRESRTVQQCYEKRKRADKAAEAARSSTDKWLEANKHKRSLPDGFYWLNDADWDGAVEVIVRIRTVESGRWEGTRFIDVALGGVWEAVTNPPAREGLCSDILKVPPAHAILRYGENTGYCGVCDEELEENSITKAHVECFQRAGFEI